MLKKFLFMTAPLAILVPLPGQATVTVQLDPGTETSVTLASYRCDQGDAFTVQYINSAQNALAVIPIDGAERIFVNVVSGSGARYVSGEYEWWSKGEEATLTNVIAGTQPQQCGPDDKQDD